MSRITGIFVSLTTAAPAWTGTDDQLYLGVVGTVGGREFNLNVAGFDDFEEGTVVPYSIGPGAAVFGGKQPITADADLADTLICQPNVTHVYLRKLGGPSAGADDAWRLQSVFLYLIAPPAPTRVFQSTGPATLSFENGLTVWLGETGHSGDFLDAKIPSTGIAACRPG